MMGSSSSPGVVAFLTLAMVACSSSSSDGGAGSSGSSGDGTSGGQPMSSGGPSTSGGMPTPTTPPNVVQDGPPAGNPDGHAVIPVEAKAEDVSSPTTVVGSGTPASCTGAAFVAAVAKGGIITFNCGPNPATIVLTSTAKVFNDKG